ncbi:Jag N-terminal domain-containing protein [Candidatus Poriferisodalis sp.]|uniref:Jag N-terminal domain-containing protein n=1 Tax=Candidatus Poriferisodalis sp. TaxID=3101277 RepID=UPI003B02277E
MLNGPRSPSPFRVVVPLGTARRAIGASDDCRGRRCDGLGPNFVEWIVVTGDTVAQARDRALDALAIADADAEYEVLASPKRSFWGLRRQPARVRMRVRPTGPPPRVDDQHRSRSRSRRRSGGARRNGPKRNVR